jgi:hypothetical protein
VMKILNANRINLAYDSFGNEVAGVILLIAGLGTQMIRWTVPFCEDLAALGYRVIRFDNRDVGCSTHFTQHATPDFGCLVSMLLAGQRPDVPYTLNDMANDAVGLLDAVHRPGARRRPLNGRHDRANTGKRASRAGSIAHLYHVEHGQSGPATGSAGRDGDDDAPRAQSRLRREDFWSTISPSRGVSQAPAIRLTKRHIAPLFWKKSDAPTIPAVSDGRLPRWP